jgi:hypothetical protein
MIPMNTIKNIGGIRIANCKAILSQVICMNIAVIKPALMNINIRIKVHLKVP